MGTQKILIHESDSQKFMELAMQFGFEEGYKSGLFDGKNGIEIDPKKISQAWIDSQMNNSDN